MRRLLAGRVGSAVAVAVVATLAIAGGYAIAAGTSNTIHACASKKTGVLRIAAQCASTERAVTWNKVGPTGPRGAIGPRGPGAKLLVYNAFAVSASGTNTKIGTAGPWTIYGKCTIDNAGAVTAQLGFTGPAVTGDLWGANSTDVVLPHSSVYPASALNTTGPEFLGRAFANSVASGSTGFMFNFNSKAGRLEEQVVVTANSVAAGQSTNTCHASDAVIPLS